MCYQSFSHLNISSLACKLPIHLFSYPFVCPSIIPSPYLFIYVRSVVFASISILSSLSILHTSVFLSIHLPFHYSINLLVYICATSLSHLSIHPIMHFGHFIKLTMHFLSSKLLSVYTCTINVYFHVHY